MSMGETLFSQSVHYMTQVSTLGGFMRTATHGQDRTQHVVLLALQSLLLTAASSPQPHPHRTLLRC